MTTTTTDSNTFRIYVASLSDYNAGILHGTWIDFDQLTDLDDLLSAFKRFHKERWANKPYRKMMLYLPGFEKKQN